MTEPKERVGYAMHWGDVGVIAIALLFLFGFIALVFAPSPLKGLDKFDEVATKARDQAIAKAEKAQHQQEIDAAVASGVVTVGIAPASPQSKH